MAARTRTSTEIERLLPMGRTSRRSMARSSFGWSIGSSSPISSMSKVPWFACSKTPRRELTAPVNAPRSCPNSSASSRFGGTAVQSRTTNGPLLRLPSSCNDSASTSLPVPVSPSMITGTSELASFSQSG